MFVWGLSSLPRVRGKHCCIRILMPCQELVELVFQSNYGKDWIACRICWALKEVKCFTSSRHFLAEYAVQGVLSVWHTALLCYPHISIMCFTCTNYKPLTRLFSQAFTLGPKKERLNDRHPALEREYHNWYIWICLDLPNQILRFI